MRIGTTSDGRLVVIRSIDESYVRTAVCDVDGGYVDYDTRGFHRRYFAMALSCRDVNLDDITWADPADDDQAVAASAFGDGEEGDE